MRWEIKYITCQRSAFIPQVALHPNAGNSRERIPLYDVQWPPGSIQQLTFSGKYCVDDTTYDFASIRHHILAAHRRSIWLASFTTSEFAIELAIESDHHTIADRRCVPCHSGPK